jgi:hypothetical protein
VGYNNGIFDTDNETLNPIKIKEFMLHLRYVRFSTNTVIHIVSELGALFIRSQGFRGMCVCSSVLEISPSVALHERIQIAVTIRYKSKSIYTGLRGEN